MNENNHNRLMMENILKYYDRRNGDSKVIINIGIYEKVQQNNNNNNNLIF